MVDQVLENTDLIVRGLVGPPRGYLAEDQAEVLTDYPIRNVTVLYSRDKLLADSPSTEGAVTVTILGGQIEINRLTFTSRHGALPALVPESDVLLCLHRDGTKYVPALRYFGAFAVRNGEVVPLTRKEGFASELRGVPVEQVVATWLVRAQRLHARTAKAPQ